MVSRIEEALYHDEVRVDYQPIFDLSTGLVVGVEALVRLLDAEGRPVPPAQLIPAAEASGLIVDLGRRVLQLAALQSARWRAEHGVLLPIAVNVSAVQVTQRGFRQDVLDAVERAGVPPEALLIELTESRLLETGSGGLEQLRQLSDAGIELSIDDFGTGYASLSLLHDLPACTLKIDQSFVAGIPDDHRAVAIVAGVIALARNFDMICIAEGIESETQLAYLAERGVHGQGFLLGRPDDASAIGRIIANGGTALRLSAAR
jgi:EAL domain-containing protein (putative c-di-GMP-specific phosphodiesterase class I)